MRPTSAPAQTGATSILLSFLAAAITPPFLQAQRLFLQRMQRSHATQPSTRYVMESSRRNISLLLRLLYNDWQDTAIHMTETSSKRGHMSLLLMVQSKQCTEVTSVIQLLAIHQLSCHITTKQAH